MMNVDVDWEDENARIIKNAIDACIQASTGLCIRNSTQHADSEVEFEEGVNAKVSTRADIINGERVLSLEVSVNYGAAKKDE